MELAVDKCENHVAHMVLKMNGELELRNFYEVLLELQYQCCTIEEVLHNHMAYGFCHIADKYGVISIDATLFQRTSVDRLLELPQQLFIVYKEIEYEYDAEAYEANY